MLSARESRMETYEQIYQELRNNDKSAWTGDGYPWAWEKLTETLDSLAATGHLPEPGSQREQAYSQVRRLLRENGTFIISSMCGEPG